MNGIGRVVSVACLVSAAAACRSGDGPPAPATAGEACVALHQAQAVYDARCMGGTVDDWLTNDEMEDCAAYDGYVADGRLFYDAAKYGGCVRQYAGPCQQTPFPTFCIRDVLAGQVANGQPCPNTEVCAGIGFCYAFGGPNTCTPICYRLSAEGEPCGNQCAPDLYCAAGTCVPGKGSGETCLLSDVAPCRSAFFCDPDVVSDTITVIDPGATGTCKPFKEGGPCRNDAQCPARDFCQAGTCVRRRALGSACADAPTGCDSWSVCTNGSCAHAGRPGEPCAPDPFDPFQAVCLAGGLQGGRCGSDGICPQLAAPGASCSAAVACVDNYTCDATTQTCRTCEP